MASRLYDIDERVLRFTCDVVAFVRTIRWAPGVNEIIDQLVDAAGSTGANRHESTAASTPREFIRQNTIALREAREAHYWLRVCKECVLGDQKMCAALAGEADEIKRILAAIVVNAKANLTPDQQRGRGAKQGPTTQ